MPKNYYVFTSGRLRRKQNTLYVENEAGKKIIPVNDVHSLLAFGELDLNTKLLTFLAQQKIPLHLFNYYGFYSGSFYPREKLLAGAVIVQQAAHYLDNSKRLVIARELVLSAAHNILQNLYYYRKYGKDVAASIDAIGREKEAIAAARSTEELMGCEGRMRDAYYTAFDAILRPGFSFEKRTRQPPENMVNCLISFGNSLLYTTCLSEIYHTQLNPTVSYLHQPGERRFSLSLDLSEVFKPVIIDRVVFNIVNNRIIKDKHFDSQLRQCYLNEEGRKVFLKAYDEKLRTTIKHRQLGRSVSYERLMRLECYKLVKHVLGDKKYSGFRMWW